MFQAYNSSRSVKMLFNCFLTDVIDTCFIHHVFDSHVLEFLDMVRYPKDIVDEFNIYVEQFKIGRHHLKESVSQLLISLKNIR